MRIPGLGLFPAIIFISFFSCNNPVQLPKNQQLQFDAEKYFLAEAERLNRSNAGITKTIRKESISEKIEIQKADWKSELQPFLRIKLNKPAQINSFIVDTILKEGHTVIIYTAKDDSEELRKFCIHLTGDNPDSIIAVKGTSNLYYQSVDTISYLGNGNYHISSRNKPRIGKEISFELDGVSVFKK